LLNGDWCPPTQSVKMEDMKYNRRNHEMGKSDDGSLARGGYKQFCVCHAAAPSSVFDSID